MRLMYLEMFTGNLIVFSCSFEIIRLGFPKSTLENIC